MKLLLKSQKFALGFLGMLFLTPALGQEKLKIEQTMLDEPGSFYFINFKKYPQKLSSLPIGVFDSGTGGLTVLDALVNFDGFENATLVSKKDGKLDFQKENFIYLADQANMPYGNYHSVQKDDLLQEHILKDFQFLLGNKYYSDKNSERFNQNKQQVKAIVIACNTATAYGYKEALQFLKETKLTIPVIGVINAASKGTLSYFEDGKSGTIAVFATAGTIASSGYENTLREQIQSLGLKGKIDIVNQGGFGLAEAVDEEPDFIQHAALAPRAAYRGPSLNPSDYKIDLALLDIYNFNVKENQMLCDAKELDDCSVLQINSAENYVRYHLVSMLEKMRKTKDIQPLKALILGCTHYPYLIKEINQVLEEIKTYRNKDGQEVYRHLISDEVQIIDPSIYVAQELYEALYQQQLFNANGDMLHQSEFYISVPNIHNKQTIMDEQGRFTYDYKYGRMANEIQEYVKVVPFDNSNVSKETLLRFKNMIPNTYQLIRNFHLQNAKLLNMDQKLKILH